MGKFKGGVWLKSKIEEWSTDSYRNPGKQRLCAKELKEYLAYHKLTPEQALKEGKVNEERITQKRILAFYKYLKEEGGKTEIMAFDYTKAIRSFYKFNDVTLNFRRNELETPRPKKKDYPIQLSHIQGMLHAAPNLRARALIITLESTGLRVGDIVELKRGDIEPFLDEDKAPIGFELVTEKKRVPAHPFLHRTAVKILKEYLASRTDNFEWLFPAETGQHVNEAEVDRMVKRVFKNAGFKNGSFRIRTHILRKFTIGRLQDSDVEENLWKSIVGKTVPEAAYSSQKLREAYMKAINRLDPNSLTNNHTKVKDLETEIQHLKKQITQLSQLKGMEAVVYLQKMYEEKLTEVNEEAFKKSVPISAAINGKKPIVEPMTIKANEQFALLALARMFEELRKKKALGEENNE